MIVNMLFIVVSILVLMVQQNNACITRSVLRIVQDVTVAGDAFDDDLTKMISINDHNVDIRYCNSNLGNKSIKIMFGQEIGIIPYWIPGLPLKVIVHGWHDSPTHKDGVFSVKNAYIDVGGYNLISVDWGIIAGNNNYMLAMMMSSKIGSRLARVLDNIIRLNLVKPIDIHLLGHSLGAHIAGVCATKIKTGKIGRITGMDPAGPGYEIAKIQKKGLRKTDALFVDVIHTSGGTTGCMNPMGHVDFFPNGGIHPQPGCSERKKFPTPLEISCSHSRAYHFYTDSVYNNNLMMGVNCTSWEDFLKGMCKTNYQTPLGHATSINARGNFFLKTNKNPPYGIIKEKEDL